MTAPVDDRRVAARLRPAAGTTCRFDPLPGDPAPVIGLVWNISLTGVSMLLGHPPKANDILTGELIVEAGGATMQVIMRAVHVRDLDTGDFLLGAQFLRPLTPDEFKQFVEPDADLTAAAK